MQGALLSLLLLAPSEVATEAMRAAVVARYRAPRLFSPGPSAMLMPRFVYVMDSGLELPLPPWQTDAAYAEAFEIARRGFHSVQPDRARALMVFTSFEEGGENLFYVPLANDVSGLGDTTAAQIFDDSPEHVVDGYIWMGSLDRLEEAGETYFREAFLHEIAHRWGSYAAVSHEELPRDALRGRQSTHWSFLLDRELSPMDGNDWVANGSQRITSLGTPLEFRFSPLDLYLMGVLSPEMVPPFEVIVGFESWSPHWLTIEPAATPAHRLGTPVTLGGVREVTVSIDHVIEGSGPRFPPAVEQVTWPIGIVFLSNGFDTPTLADLQLLDRRIEELVARFEEASGGRMRVEVAVDGAGTLLPGASCTALEECNLTLSDACAGPERGAESICTRTCRTEAECGPGQCCTSGICAPSHYCGNVMQPIEDGGMRPAVPPPPGGGLVTDPSRGCSCSATHEAGSPWLGLALLLSRVLPGRRRRPQR